MIPGIGGLDLPKDTADDDNDIEGGEPDDDPDDWVCQVAKAL